MLGDILNFVLNFFSDLVSGVLSFLPDSPIQSINFSSTIFPSVLGWINYFVPIGGMITIFTVYLSAAAVWYGIRWILRIGRYIE